MDNHRETELGALWRKEGPSGPFMTGSVQVEGVKVDIVVFPNGFKEKDNQPDFRILKSRPREERESTRRDERQYQRPREEAPRRPQEPQRAGRAQWPDAPSHASPRSAGRPQPAAKDWTEEVPPHPIDPDDDSIPF